MGCAFDPSWNKRSLHGPDTLLIRAITRDTRTSLTLDEPADHTNRRAKNCASATHPASTADSPRRSGSTLGTSLDRINARVG